MKRTNRKRTKANARENALGFQGRVTTNVADMFSNPMARTGYGTPSLGEGAQYNLDRLSFNYVLLYSIFEEHWISRRIVETPAKDMVRAWPKITSDIDPKDLSKIDRAVRRTNTKGNLLTAMTWGRLFGGAGCLIAVDGQDKELDQPLDLDSIPLGGFKGLLPFDCWSGIHASGEVCQDISKPADFNMPEFYEVTPKGGDSFRVHCSRILRCTGLPVPSPEREAYANLFGHISVLAPVYQEIQKRDNASWNILNLTFRANILAMKFPELGQILSGLNAPQAQNQKFEQRLSAINHLISNQSLVPLPTDGSIEATQYSFAGLGEVYQQFQLDISGAAQIPVSRLWGRTMSGLGGSSNEGDEKVYEERIATDQDTELRPQLEKLFPVICASELGDVPDDLDLTFPSVRVLDEKEKSDLAKTAADTITVVMNGGLISPRTGAKELKQQSDVTGLFTNITDEDIAALSDKVQAEGELGEGVFGEEGAQTLDPAESPTRVLKESDKLASGGKGAQEPADAPTGRQEPPKGGLKAQAKDGDEHDEGIDYLRKSLLAAGYKRVSVKPRDYRDTNRVDVYCDAVGNRDQVREDIEARGARYGVRVLTVNVSGANYGPAFDADGPAVSRLRIHGVPIVLETPKGGQRGPYVMSYDYGYLPGHMGADGDSLDAAVGPDHEANWVYVFDQRHMNKRAYDESKCFFGYGSMDAAVKAFNAGHDKACIVYMDCTPMQVDDFKQWLKERDPRRPAGSVEK